MKKISQESDINTSISNSKYLRYLLQITRQLFINAICMQNFEIGRKYQKNLPSLFYAMLTNDRSHIDTNVRRKTKIYLASQKYDRYLRSVQGVFVDPAVAQVYGVEAIVGALERLVHAPTRHLRRHGALQTK